MMMIKNPKVLIALTTTASLMLTGCAHKNKGTGSSNDEPCNVIAGAVIGAIGGALLDKDKRGRGAAVGGAAGALACVAVNAVTRRTRTSQQVEDEYKAANAGQLPQGAPVLQSYNVRVNPSTDVKSGERFQVVSNITVVRSANQAVSDVRESLTLTAPDGNTRTAEKAATEQPGSGAFENTFTLSLPAGVAPGSYPVTTRLSVNGKVAAERQQTLRIAAARDGGVIVALLDVQ
jgi:hypothetical protein